MIQIQNLGDDARQQTTVLLADGTAVVLSFTYRPTVQRWAFDVLYDGKIYNSIGLCVHPNVLRGHRGVLPFGLMCASTDGLDPFDISDFSSSRITLFVLDSSNGGTEVQTVETDFFT